MSVGSSVSDAAFRWGLLVSEEEVVGGQLHASYMNIYKIIKSCYHIRSLFSVLNEKYL